MPVAVKNSPETGSLMKSLFDRLAFVSLAGTVYVLGSLGIVFYALPALWDLTVFPLLGPYTFVAGAGLILAMLVVAAGLVYLGTRLAGPNPPHGLRAGIATGVLGVILILLITLGIGHMIQNSNWTAANNPTVGLPLTAGIGVVLLILAIRGFLTPTAERAIVQVEDQGWFSSGSYKKSQGLRVRRGTMLGILLLVGCGIYTLLSHKTLEAGPTNWAPGIPFTDYAITTWKVVGPFPRVEDRQYGPEKGLPETREQWGTTTYTGVGEKSVRWDEVQGDAQNHGMVDLSQALHTTETNVVGYAVAEIASRWERNATLQLGSDDSLVVWLNGKKIHEFRRDRDWEPRQDSLTIKLEKGQNRLLVKTGHGPKGWRFSAEVSPGQTFLLLPHVRFTIPLLLAALGLWLAYRAVNFAPFADFLIATEAEMNKVSWTTRRRLVQDTIVVLVCVILLTLFLFVVDILWGWILSSEPISVLMVDQDVKDYIARHDDNHDGYIDTKEAEKAGIDMERWDENHDGRLDRSEVKKMLRQLSSQDQTTPW
jgi:preprotein translocase SecE subunit